MRVRRQKNHRRVLRFYRLAFGVQEPYKVLVDGTIITHALQNKIHIKEQLPKLLGGRATPSVTGCVLAELRALGSRALGAAIIAKGYYRVKCGHDDKPIGAAACCLEQIGKSNDRKFLVATQDPELTQTLRQVPGVPIISINGQVPRVEEPSSASRSIAAGGEKRKLEPSAWEKPKLVELKQREIKAKALAETPKKRKGPKGPNPLSCLSSKKMIKAAKAAVAAREAAEAQAAAERMAKPKRVRSRRGAAQGPTAAEADGGGTAAAAATAPQEP
eukprot:CAMPEP_0195128538 /NCGR_PEP_ID=MMETSP0448-20130528/139412_1 /TAXON_ID=66468 /ORGANISM="Heterocapsa triquestra, Strain CCMP 448" /LENGTH=273 /DNA_ID=CAMNT_0040166345 /DNA_START=26 /DNA_END=844 /DNA_ORIENTATION=+